MDTLHHIALPGTSLAYRVQGGGPDVLLLHGWLSSSRLWLETAEALSLHFRCWAIDLPGSGASIVTDETTITSATFAHYRQVIHSFCEVMHISPYAVVGHSMGGLLALSLALESPEFMERLVILSAPIRGRLPSHTDELIKWDKGLTLMERLRPLWTLGTWLYMPFVFARPATLKSRQYQAMLRKIEDARHTEWPVAMSGAQSIVNTNYEHRLHEVQQPTLIICGQQDRTVLPEDSAFAAARIPNAQYLPLEHVAHQVTDEAPALVNWHLLDFLKPGSVDLANRPVSPT